MARIRDILLAVPAAGMAAVAVGAVWLYTAAMAAGPLEADKRVYIESGSSVSVMADTLERQNVIGDGFAFRIVARIANRRASLKAGEYEFPAHASIASVVAILQGGKTYQHQITVPEGLTSAEIVALLQQEPVLQGAVTDVPPDGSLLPETYNFSYGDTRQTLLDRMMKAMQVETAAAWAKRAPDLALSSVAEAVTLASVVEKETGVASERPRIAGVFLNRLRGGIPLQSDPTVIYALTKGAGALPRALTTRDLKVESPYNTYLVRGLPPGPIANPGRAALDAVLHPEKNDFIYFVADGTGGHVFSKTLKEHENNVRKWRQLQRAGKP